MAIPSSVTSIKIAPYRIIEEYHDTSNNLDFVFNDISKELDSEQPNEECLHRLFHTLKTNLKRYNAECPPHLKNRIAQLSIEKESSLHGFAVSFHLEVEKSINFMIDFISNPRQEHISDRAYTDSIVRVLTRGCFAYKYLKGTQYRQLQEFAQDFNLKEWWFKERNALGYTSLYVMGQMKTAIDPVKQNPQQRRFEFDVPIVKPLSEIEELSSAESWETINAPSPPPVATSSSSMDAPSMNSIKKTLVEYIEGVLGNVLKHYGETFLHLLTVPLDQVFKGEKIGEIIDQALSNTATPFTKEDKEAWKNFLCQSVPTLAREFLAKTTDTINDPGNGYQFIHGITRLISPLCFKTPEQENDSHKTLLLCVLSQLNLFLKDYQTACMSIKPHVGATEETLEQDILCAMIQNLQSRSERVIFRNEQDPKIFAEDISHYIEHMIEIHMQTNEVRLPSPLNECVKAVVNHYLYSILDIVFSPFIIAIGIHRFVDNIEEIDHPKEGSSIPLPEPVRDDQFSRALANQLWEMIHPILNMGGNPTMISWIIKTFEKRFKKFLLGKSKEIDAELQNIMNSDCVLMPFILLDKMLFNHRNGKHSPALRTIISSSAATKESFTKTTIQNFRGRPYAIISKIIKDQTSTFTLKMAETFGNIDTFLTTVFNRLINLTGQEKIIKLLIIYLCNAYLDYISRSSANNTKPSQQKDQ